MLRHSLVGHEECVYNAVQAKYEKDHYMHIIM